MANGTTNGNGTRNGDRYLNGPHRPRKLTRKLLERLLEIVSWGNFEKHAYLACGVAKDTWLEWKRDGRAETPLGMFCPHCKVKKGQRCRNPKGEEIEGIHARRQAKYDAAGIYRELVARLPAATASAIVHHVEALHKGAASGEAHSVKAATAYLSRRGGPGWIETKRLESTGKDGGPIEHEVEERRLVVVTYPLNKRGPSADCLEGQCTPGASVAGITWCAACGREIPPDQTEDENAAI